MLEVLVRIRHRRTRRQLSPYLDGMLSDAESRRLEAHLAQCRACGDELAELRATVQSLAELPLAEAPRSFALTAAPQRIEAPRLGGARRLEFGLGLATVAVAFVLAVVASGDLLGVPGDDEGGEDASVREMANVEPTVAGIFQGLVTPAAPQDLEAGADDKALTVAPTTQPAAGLTEGYGGGEPVTPVRSPATGPGPSSEVLVPGIAEPETPAATATAAATATPAATATAAAAASPEATGAPASVPAPEAPPLAETPVPAETPSPTEAPFFAFGLGGTPEAGSPASGSETAAATATPPPIGAAISPSEIEEQPLSEANEQALAETERKTLAAEEEGGPSRETVVRWLEVGLATGAALLFVTWVLARRWGRA
jgi:hypothetical protein